MVLHEPLGEPLGTARLIILGYKTFLLYIYVNVF